MKLQKLIKRACASDFRTAVSALGVLEERISPQGAAFTEEAVAAIPMLLDAAMRSKVSIRGEILNYLGEAYEYTLGTWQFRWDDEPARRHHFTEMVAWEKSISKSYRDSIASVTPLLGADNSEAVRSSAAYLPSNAGFGKGPLDHQRPRRSRLVCVLDHHFQSCLHPRSSSTSPRPARSATIAGTNG